MMLNGCKREWRTDDGSVVLYQGDCLEILPQLEGIDAIVTDPPYGTTNSSWDSEIPLQEMWRCIALITKSDSPVVLFGAEPFSSHLRASNWLHWRYDWIWKKSRPTRFLDANRMPLSCHEIISVFGRSRPRYFPRMTSGVASHGGGVSAKATSIYHSHEKVNSKSNDGVQFPRSVIEFPSLAPGMRHPNQKPDRLIEYMVETYSETGDLVLDFTMGSGTTGVACARLGRKFIGIEREPSYFDIACERITEELNRYRAFESVPKVVQRSMFDATPSRESDQ